MVNGSFVCSFSEIWKIVFLQIYESKYSSVAITEYKPISLVFGKYWFKTIMRQKSATKNNRKIED